MKKTVLVTGSAKGIGAAIIKEFGNKGYNCVINYKTSKDEAFKLQKELFKNNVECLVIKADVSKEDEVDAMFKEIENKFGGVDVLVNNAAIDLSDLYLNQNVDDFKKTIDVNLIGAYISSKRAYKYMRDKNFGRIINIASTNGINTYYPVSLAYDASKAALISLTHNLAIQFAPFATVNAVAPGFIGTKSELEGYDEEFLKQEVDKILLKRYGNAEEVAKVVYFLASDDASYINNTVIRIDGGQYGSN
ncbi:MAG: SDR family oxidoreductase [Bacilli bacterium]|nr:SDR family oxidoreductase [Bacilli bacterium]